MLPDAELGTKVLKEGRPARVVAFCNVVDVSCRPNAPTSRHSARPQHLGRPVEARTSALCLSPCPYKGSRHEVLCLHRGEDV